jgi:hypothetical protein
MRPREVGRIARQFTVLIAPRNTRGCQQGLAARPQAAIAARYPAVSGRPGLNRKRLPSRAIAERTNLRRCFSQHSILLSVFSLLKLYSPTLHQKAAVSQARNPHCLCTSCAATIRAVEAGGKPALGHGQIKWRCRHPAPRLTRSCSGRWLLPNPPRQPQSGTWGCETGFWRGFSQLTFSPERGKYQPSGFSLGRELLSSRIRPGKKETCEEKL